MQYSELLEKQIITRLRTDNPWWTEGCIPSYYAQMQPRPYFERFYSLATDTDIDRAVVLMGPRRVGKTVMLYHTIQRLIQQGVNPQNIIYASIETPLYLDVYLELIFNLARRALGKDESNRNERFYLFFDEIQYLKNWEINLKSLVDTYKACKFVVSGSAAAALRKGSSESGAGRFTDFMLPPLTFYEYVNMKSYANILYKNNQDYYYAVDIEKLNTLFVDYINYGGYPEIVFSAKTRENTELFIKHDIIEKVLLKDLPGIYGIADSQELNALFTMIAFNSGGQFSYEKLAQQSGIKKDTLKKYIQYLEASFLIRRVRRADHTARNYKRESAFKIYLTNPSLRCALFKAVDSSDEFIGNMVETAIFAQLNPNNQNIAYANWNSGGEGEVDLVTFNPATQQPDKLVEIKWTDKPFANPSILKSLEYFMETNSVTSAIVTSLTQQGTKQIHQGDLQFVPSACFAYTLGERYAKTL